MIELSSITKTYQMGDITVSALRGVSLKIVPGEFIAIMGQSGSGKSTLLHLLGLLDKPDSGTFRFMDRDITALDEDELAHLRSETIGFVFQQFHLLSRTTAVDNVALPLIYRRHSHHAANPAALLERVGLGERLTHRPNELSGGQQQRVAIARALVNRPAILMADEPTGNLDSASGREIMELFQQLNREGITVILVTHEPRIAEYARRIIRIEDGLIKSDETRTETDSSTALSSQQNAIRSTKTEASLPPLAEMGRKFWIYLSQASRALFLNKMRTSLSALGIVIGVAAVIAMLALGSGAQSSVSKQMAGLGSNRLVVRANAQNLGGVRQQSGAVSRMTEKQVEELRRDVSGIKALSAEVRTRVQIVGGGNNANTEAAGVSPSYVEVNAAQPAYGRFFTEQENQTRQRVALLGVTVVKSLFGTRNPVGETVKVNRVPFRVIGVLPAKGATGPRDEDDVVVIPVQTAMHRLLGKNYYDSINLTAADAQSVNAVQQQVLQRTESWPKTPGTTDAAYRVDNLASIQEAFSAVARTLSVLLAAIAAISLIVGGIGIMNIMLVSVAERTREIGLRKAIGGRNIDIMMQFLIESVVLCLTGGLSGVLMGSAIVLILSQVTGWGLGISPFSVLLGCGSSALIGIGFGLWPARQASRLNPIEALRSE